MPIGPLVVADTIDIIIVKNRFEKCTLVLRATQTVGVTKSGHFVPDKSIIGRATTKN